MKIFVVLSLLVVFIGTSNAGNSVSLNLLKFERMVYNLAEVIISKYKQLHEEITQIVSQDPLGKGPDPNAYLYIYPNIPKTVGQIYTNLQSSLIDLISTLPKLVNLQGSGPNIVLTSSEYTQLQNGLINILNADIAAGNVLTTQHNLLLKINSDADISANGQSLYVPIPELEEIMQLTIDFNLTNVELGKTFKALGSLASTTNIDEQQSEEASKVVSAFFKFLTLAGNNFVVAGLAGSDLSMNIRLASHLHDDLKTYVVNLQSLYNAWNSAGEQCMDSYDVVRLGMVDLLDSFYGSYQTTVIPM